jgi:small subunit ribosomal protein S14
MAKQSSIQKNLNRKKIVSKYKNQRQNLKKKIMEKNISMEERFKLQAKLNDLPRDSSANRVRNRCELTGRTRGVYRKFSLSRIKLRELTMSGSLPGVTKSSW